MPRPRKFRHRDRVKWKGPSGKTETGTILTWARKKRRYRVRRDLGGRDLVRSRDMKHHYDRVLILEGRLTRNLASRREYANMMQRWLSAYDVKAVHEKVHTIAGLRGFLTHVGRRLTTRVIHITCHGKNEDGTSTLHLLHENIDLSKDLDGIRLPGKILLLSCCEVGSNRKVMQHLADELQVDALVAYRRAILDSYANICDALFYEHLFRGSAMRLETGIERIYQAMKHLRIDDGDERAVRMPVMKVYR